MNIKPLLYVIGGIAIGLLIAGAWFLYDLFTNFPNLG